MEQQNESLQNTHVSIDINDSAQLEAQGLKRVQIEGIGQEGEEDQEFLSAFYEIEALDQGINLEHISPWVLRFELDTTMMVDAQLTMADIGECIRSQFNGMLLPVFSDDNADKLVLRVRLLHAPIPADQPAVSKYNNDHNQHGKLIC